MGACRCRPHAIEAHARARGRTPPCQGGPRDPSKHPSMPRDRTIEELRALVIRLSQQLEDVPPASLARLRAVEDALGELRAAVRELSAEVAALRGKVEPRSRPPRLSAALVREFLDSHTPAGLARSVRVSTFGDRRLGSDLEGPVRRYLAAVMPEIVAEAGQSVLQEFVAWVNARPRKGAPK